MSALAQVAIITGSGQGLGAAAAKLFAQQGARVLVTDLDGAKAEQVQDICVTNQRLRNQSLVRSSLILCSEHQQVLTSLLQAPGTLPPL